MYESNDKMVSHPAHYQSKDGLEVIDVIKAFTADLTGIEAVDTGNIIKYICRWKHKNGLQDLEKALWYLQDLIENVKNEMIVDKFNDVGLVNAVSLEDIKGLISEYNSSADVVIDTKELTPEEAAVIEAIIHGNS